MKIIHLVGFYPEIGGPFIAVKNLLIKLSEKGIFTKVISTIPKNYDINKLAFVNNLPFEVKYLKEQLPRSIWPSFSLKLRTLLKNEIEKTNIIHLAGLFDFYSILFLSQKNKFIYSPRGTFMKEAYYMNVFKRLKKDIYLKLIGKTILKKANIIHLITEEEKKHFLEFFPQFENKLRVIPNGLDFSEFNNQIDKKEFITNYPELKNKKIILFLGRINWKKGLDILIEGFAKLYSEKNNVHLVIAGKDDGDGYENKVKRWVKKFNLENATTFTGFITGKHKLQALYGSDVFIMPSYSENFGVSAIEAMACGLPVVVSNKVGIFREISQWNAGIIIDVSADGVYNGLKQALENGGSIKQLAENGKKMVYELYDINKVTDKMIELYEEVLRS